MVFTKSLEGHSDADVLIHSICDAILGALNKGNIGEHFSDKDQKNKNKKSSIFLKKIMKFLKDDNYWSFTAWMCRISGVFFNREL